MIIERVGNKNPEDNFGWSPLHYAAMNGHVEVCRLIINNVDNKHPLSNLGTTPKNMANIWNHFAVFQLFHN